MALDVVVYFDSTQQEHEQQVAALPADGYQLVTLDIYGREDAPPEEVRYVAAWVKRAGPVQRFFQVLSRAALTAALAEQDNQGYRPALLAASGNWDFAVYAVVFEPYDPARDLVATFDQTDWLSQEQDARDLQRVPRSVSVYGPTSYFLFAAIWERVNQKVAWTSPLGDFSGHGPFDTVAEFQERFNVWYSHGLRPSAVSVLPYDRWWDQRQFFSVFRDDFVGWRLSRHGWSKIALEREIDFQAAANNMYPLSLSGGGSTDNPRFAAVLVQREQPLPRQWNTIGPEQPALASLDGVMKGFMQSAAAGDPDIRAGALAVIRRGKLIYAKAYTRAEAGYETTLPTSLFRLASCTKPLTAIAIFRLIEQGLLGLDTPLLSVLGDTVRRPDGQPPLDPRWSDITIDHLLAHSSGVNRDPPPNELVSTQMFGAALPTTHEQIVSALAERMLRFDPGTNSVYSNIGFMMLGMVIERITALRYDEAMDQLVFRPLGLTRPRLGRSLVEHRHPGEVRYEGNLPRLGRSLRQQSNRPLVPEVYGGFGLEQFGGAGAYAMSVVDYARILAALDAPGVPLLTEGTIDTMWSVPEWLPGFAVFRGWFPGFSYARSVNWHNGYLPGTAALVWRRDDGISVAAFFNKNTWLYPYAGICYDINRELEAITNWPNQDLFESFGLPSF